MDNLCIKLPEEFHAPQEFGLDSNPESIQKWLAELPLANTQQSAEEVLTLIRELNRSELPPLLRYQHLKVILPVADCLGEILRSHYSGALLPLSSKNLKKHSVVSNLSNALATGFRLIEKQLREHNHIKWREKGLLVTCLYLAIQQLSNILLDYYLVYFPEPQKIWGEINRLYSYAEKHQLLDTVVPQGENSSLELTVSHIYKSVLMLATASPYHMMQQEALNLRKYFDAYQTAKT